MLRVNAFFVLLLIVFSVSSVANAATPLPLATSNLDPKYNSVDENALGETSIHTWDALDISMLLNDDDEVKKYTVVQGDNLFRIAVNHGVSLQSLIGWNDLTSDLIHPGDVLIVSGEEVDEITPIKSHFEEKKKVVTTSGSSQNTNKTKPNNNAPPSNLTGKEMIVTATAYTAYCDGCSGTTAYGIDLRANPNQKVIAVDPRIIPLGTKVWVEGYGEAIAGDTGGAIKGNKIDVFIPTYENAIAWGVKTVKIRVLN
ncbi:3D domain-containing protein [Lysinibacillus sp. 54212]|uniref:3D domain-containing protein n=1 Tax=Lysinibacillus sp. 54212 TaxID=3119829 RepID=UPI002FC6682B